MPSQYLQTYLERKDKYGVRVGDHQSDQSDLVVSVLDLLLLLNMAEGHTRPHQFRDS